MNLPKPEIKIRKKHLIGVIVGIVIIAAAIIWIKWPYHEYENLGMRPEWKVSDNILNAKKSQVFAHIVDSLEYTTFLDGEGPYTVFVPTDDAFDNLPQETKDFLGEPENQWAIRQTVLYHVVKGKYLASDFSDGLQLETVQGEKLTITRKNNYWVINNYAYLETYDVVSTNGVIHIITNFILPPSMLQ